jgi:hypothetical protein
MRILLRPGARIKCIAALGRNDFGEATRGWIGESISIGASVEVRLVLRVWVRRRVLMLNGSIYRQQAKRCADGVQNFFQQ